MNGELYVNTGMGKPDKEPFRAGEQEPWVYRGGLHGEFRVSGCVLILLIQWN